MDERNPAHRTPEDVIERVLSMMRTSEFKGVAFRTDLEQDVVVNKPVDRDGKVSIAITTSLGHRRTERWDQAKIAQYLRAGFWFAEVDGVVHDGGHAEAKRSERRRSEAQLGDIMEKFTLQRVFQDALGMAGLADEAASLRRSRIERFDVEGAKTLLAELFREAGPGLAARLVTHGPDDEAEDELEDGPAP